jgi:hypothetical protein
MQMRSRVDVLLRQQDIMSACADAPVDAAVRAELHRASFGSSQSFWLAALANGLVDRAEFDLAARICGSLWNYAGD